MGLLGKYFKKRRFKDTPEPHGKLKKTPSKRLAFVVQEHDATRLHYDFRLELHGVLKSWAVPKGPSLDPHEHHLAVETEDHPYEYRKFEGVIPENNYGAGSVIIWDEGWYEARGDDKSEDTLQKQYEKGHMTFVLHGSKLRGEFALVKMPKAAEEKAWLLIKKDDEFASKADVTKLDTSVKSHKRVSELGKNSNSPNMTVYPKKTSPWAIKPMLSTLVDEPFDSSDWLFENKWDGYRAIGSKKNDSVELYSRAGTDFSSKYPPVKEALRSMEHDVIFDGEIVIVDKEGRPHFEWLQSWSKVQEGFLRYYIFDILWIDGYDIRTMPLIERKELLKEVIPEDSILHYSDHVEAEGKALFRQMQEQKLEGMVAKKKDGTYREGFRGDSWLKIKTHMRQEVVIGGYTEPRGGRKYLGALVTGVYNEAGEFVYVGHSGGGIPDRLRKELAEKLQRLERKTSPFLDAPKPNAPVHWVEPKLVAEMSFSEWTKEGYMRQPTFEGMRDDKKPTAVKKEKTHKKSEIDKTAAAKPTAGVVEITHPDKIFFPKHKYTKGDIAAYYTSVAEYILPYLKDRACSMLRMPDGITGPSFFQKNNEHLPEWVPYADIFSESNKGDLRWVKGGELQTLLYMVQLGCIEINPWNSRVQNLEKPDWIVIDLDPEGVDFTKVVEVAHTVKEVCDEWKIPCHPKTSGKTGIHIYIPMGAKYTYEQAKNLAHLIALEINKRQPKITSVERMPEKRQHKIYLDFLQNREGQTLAAPYSVRPTPDASVSMPLEWSEITSSLRPTDFTIKNALIRIKQKGDIWKPVLGEAIHLRETLARIEKSSS